jgi:hypothetical protein
MSILSYYDESKYHGRINVSDPLNCNPIIKFPTPVVELSLTINEEYGKNQINQNPSQYEDVIYELDDIRASLSFGSLPIARNSDSYLSVHPTMPQEVKFHFKLNPSDIAYIESQRVDDVSLAVAIWGEMQPYNEVRRVQLPGMLRFQLDFQWNFSQAKWSKFLSDIGYSEKWIIEIDRPKLEGYHEVTEHLEKAKEALFNKNDPEDVLRDLRAARDSFRTYYDSHKDAINEIIDKDSTGELGWDSKSKRIEEIYDGISNFLNIGPHSDKYKVTYADAQLAFRQIISMLSYLSPIISEIENNEEKKGK